MDDIRQEVREKVGKMPGPISIFELQIPKGRTREECVQAINEAAKERGIELSIEDIRGARRRLLVSLEQSF